MTLIFLLCLHTAPGFYPAPAAPPDIVLVTTAPPSPGSVTSTSPELVVCTATTPPSATPLAVTASPTAGTFLQDNDPAPLEWSA